MALKYRLILAYYHVIDVEGSPPRTLEELREIVNSQFHYVLKQWVDRFNFSIVGATGRREDLQCDDHLISFLQSCSGPPSIEASLTKEHSAQMMHDVCQQLYSRDAEIQRLQTYVTDLREQGYGGRQAYDLLGQIAPVPDDQVAAVIINNGGADSIVTVVVGNPSDIWTAQQGLRGIGYMAHVSPEQCAELFRSGAIQPTISTMVNFPEDVQVQAFGNQALAGLVADTCREHIAEIFQHNGVDVIVGNMMRFNDLRLHQHGCWALASLADSPEHQSQIVRHGGVHAILAAMHHFPGDAMIQRYGLASLQTLCSESSAEEIQRVIDTVIRAMANHPNDAHVVSLALRTALHMVKYGEATSMPGTNFITAILNVMAAHPQDADICEYGLRVLAGLALNSTENQLATTQLNGMPTVLHAINTLSEKTHNEGLATVIGQSISLLANLAMHPENRVVIMRHSGLETVLNFMRSPFAMHEQGLRFIASLACDIGMHKALIHGGSLEAIINAMREYPEEVGIQVNGCYALGMLAGCDENKVKIVQAGGIHALLTAMYNHASSAHVHEQSCAALAILCEMDEQKIKVRECHGLPVVVDSLSNHNQTCDVIKQVYKLVALLALEYRNQEDLCDLHCLDIIIAALHIHERDADALYYGFKAISNLCIGVASNRLNLKDELIDISLQSLIHFPRENKIQEGGCEVLSVLARIDNYQNIIRQKGGIRLVCDALISNTSHTGVQRKACRAIANLAESEENRKYIRQEGGLELVVQAIDLHVSHPEVGEQGCAAIANLALDDNNRRHIAQINGVEAVLVGLREHGNHPGIQAHGLGALGNLAVEEENRRVILRAGAIRMVLNAMNHWAAEARVQHFGCLALSNFAHDADHKIAIGQEGGINLIIIAMVEHQSHPGVAEQGCGALANLGVQDDNMVEIARLNGIAIVIESLKRHHDNQAVQQNGCFALSKFLAMPNENYRRHMVQAGLITFLQMIQKSSTSDVLNMCIRVLLRRLQTDERSTSPLASPRALHTTTRYAAAPNLPPYPAISQVDPRGYPSSQNLNYPRYGGK